MKRKLNEHDVPEVSRSNKPTDGAASFESLALDHRLLQAVQQQQWSKPTPIQAQAIPLALNGKDVIARSRTGSGKTAAYLLPILEKILKQKTSASGKKSISALILVPTRELATQVTKVAESLVGFCGNNIRIENLARKEDEKVARARLLDAPDVVLTTPGRASSLVNASVLSLAHLSHLVIDEADLMLSYDYEDDLGNIAKNVPKGVHTVLMSATLRADVETLKGLFCRDPVTLELDQEEEDSELMKQFVVSCAEDEKFLLFYALFKLNLIKGKVIVFVGDIDRSYRLKLFGNQFGIRSCVLNSELPVNSRLHIVEEFNRGVYDIIIASDDQDVIGNEGRQSKSKDVRVEAGQERGKAENADDEGNISNIDERDEVADKNPTEVPETQSGAQPKKKRKTVKQDKEYGVARGIDFKNVACVINFDLPTSSKSYEHRIGRTARAGNTGMALSFVIPKDKFRGHKPTSFPQCENDEEVLAKISKSQQKKGREVVPYNFDMKRLDGFRYRLADALRAVTKIAIRQARTEELRQELMKSEKLKRHFEENPTDLHHLRHDGEYQPHRIQPHLRHVPDYLLPGGSTKSFTEGQSGFVGLRKQSENRIRAARSRNKVHGKIRKATGKKSDPLKSFNAKGRR